MREMVTMYFLGLYPLFAFGICIWEQREVVSASLRPRSDPCDPLSINRSYIIRTNKPGIRRSLFRSHLENRPRRAAPKDHLSPIPERQTTWP